MHSRLIARVCFSCFVAVLTNAYARGDGVLYTICAYIILNLVFATMLERKKHIIAVIFHSMMFFGTLTLLVLCAENGILADSACNFLGERYYRIVLTMMSTSDVSIFVPFAVAELLVVIQMAVVAFFIAMRIVIRLRDSADAKQEEFDRQTNKPVCHTKCAVLRKLCYLFAQIRC